MEIEGDGRLFVGLQARLMSQASRKPRRYIKNEHLGNIHKPDREKVASCSGTLR